MAERRQPSHLLGIPIEIRRKILTYALPPLDQKILAEPKPNRDRGIRWFDRDREEFPCPAILLVCQQILTECAQLQALHGTLVIQVQPSRFGLPSHHSHATLARSLDVTMAVAGSHDQPRSCRLAAQDHVPSIPGSHSDTGLPSFQVRPRPKLPQWAHSHQLAHSAVSSMVAGEGDDNSSSLELRADGETVQSCSRWIGRPRQAGTRACSRPPQSETSRAPRGSSFVVGFPATYVAFSNCPNKSHPRHDADYVGDKTRGAQNTLTDNQNSSHRLPTSQKHSTTNRIEDALLAPRARISSDPIDLDVSPKDELEKMIERRVAVFGPEPGTG